MHGMKRSEVGKTFRLNIRYDSGSPDYSWNVMNEAIPEHDIVANDEFKLDLRTYEMGYRWDSEAGAAGALTY